MTQRITDACAILYRIRGCYALKEHAQTLVIQGQRAIVLDEPGKTREPNKIAGASRQAFTSEHKRLKDGLDNVKS
jgi:hypothetical protein